MTMDTALYTRFTLNTINIQQTQNFVYFEFDSNLLKTITKNFLIYRKRIVQIRIWYIFRKKISAGNCKMKTSQFTSCKLYNVNY
jgi:hypothetical protein